MKHVKWLYPEREDDYTVHFLKDSEWTLCGSAFEGGDLRNNDYRRGLQGFKVTKEKVTCPMCIDIVKLVKRVKESEYESKG